MSYPLYRLITRMIGLIQEPIYWWRVRAGKEDVARLNERRARNLPPRPEGPVIWLHGASVGEIKLLRALADIWDSAQQSRVPHFLFTSQTRTSASLFETTPRARQMHQYLPLDTVSASRRFIAHWRPDIAIFAEGEIWPNIIRAAHVRGIPLVLINARMTEKSQCGWAKRPKFARSVFAQFQHILAANRETASALTQLSGRQVDNIGNIKIALTNIPAKHGAGAELKTAFCAGRHCFLAASTHRGEEALFIEAYMQIRTPLDNCAIIAPRHPERGDEIRELAISNQLSVAQRSRGEKPHKGTQIYIADTLDEMPIWYDLADAIYLGGANTPNVGGHNPIEILYYRKALASGPDYFNFSDVFTMIKDLSAVSIVDTADQLADWMHDASSSAITDWKRVETWLASQGHALERTIDVLEAVLAQNSDEVAYSTHNLEP